jgi:hypothetical protein
LPTVVRDLPDDARLVRHEQFGPICGSAWKKEPGDGVIGVEEMLLIPVVWRPCSTTGWKR